MTDALIPTKSLSVRLGWLNRATPLKGVELVVAEALQALGCIWLLGILGFLIVAFGLFRIFHITRVLQMNQEISLLIAHVIILTSRTQTNMDLCRFISGLLHYLFLTNGTFLVLEAVHSFSVASSMVNSGGLLSRLGYVGLGWGAPALATLVSAPLVHKAPSAYSCWFNYNSHTVIAGLGGSLLATYFVAMVTAESIGMVTGRGAPLASGPKKLTAKLSGLGLLVNTPLSVFSWLIGSLALYDQNVALFGIVFASNVALGVGLIITRTLSSPEIRNLMIRIGQRLHLCNI